ncbi:spore germination protein [Paenibacillus sp. J23TS9]|uniref:spore germination protein n=1 Tax=Paenibacillus sp. J23TS9 TaxID=2807193 RepID=UPI001B2C70CC|nr:spore germination protein [Paenibacillus sp. J23TS9]GIP27120.1 spore germination protein [Paenibacillus sp. J23TS9]
MTAKHKPITLEYVLHEFEQCVDLIHRNFPMLSADMVYFDHLIDKDAMEREVLQPFANVQADELDHLLKDSRFNSSSSSKEIIEGILKGDAAIFHESSVYLVSLYGPSSRSIEQSETEAVIIGPHDAFTESAFTNLSLIRRKLKSSHLKAIQLSVGEVAKSDVFVLYIDGIVNMEFVNEMIKRIRDIEVDIITDSNMLVQHIDDYPNTIFPLFLTTERPDLIVSKLSSGRVAVIMDESPSVISGPTSLFEFFTSPDDYYQRWIIGTATRILRYIAFIITITFTAVYVAITTYHYEMIPENLLYTLIESRSRVPFPPVFEALLMEVTIELLREAGARLPSKIGQTIGIVGGIVIGQAAVQAGLTSNILIIAVALSAIASFVIPSYVMSASIRFARFFLIILAGIWGNFGLMIGISILVIHLSKLTSLGSSYITPIAPLNFQDWKDSFIRGPFWMLKDRPAQSRTHNKVRNKMKR